MKSFKLFFILIFLIFPKLGFSGFYIQESIFPTFGNDNSGSFNDKRPPSSTMFSYNTNTSAMIKFDIVLLGATFRYDKSEFKSPKSDNANDSYEATTRYIQFGPSVGAVYSGLHLIGTWFPLASYTEHTLYGSSPVTSDQTVKDKTSLALQINLGYTFEVTQVLRIGPSLIYNYNSFSSETSKDEKVAGINYTDKTFNIKKFISRVYPYVSFAFEF